MLSACYTSCSSRRWTGGVGKRRGEVEEAGIATQNLFLVFTPSLHHSQSTLTGHTAHRTSSMRLYVCNNNTLRMYQIGITSRTRRTEQREQTVGHAMTVSRRECWKVSLRVDSCCCWLTLVRCFVVSLSLSLSWGSKSVAAYSVAA